MTPEPNMSEDFWNTARSVASKLERLFFGVWSDNEFYRARWEDVGLTPRPVRSLEALRRYPLVTREELVGDQASRRPPTGSNRTFPAERYCRVSRSSGTSGKPLYWFDTAESWSWLTEASARLYETAGVQDDDRVMVFAQFGSSLGPWSLRDGASRRGCLALSVGPPFDEAANEFDRFRPTVVAGTPRSLLSLARGLRDRGLAPRQLDVERVIASGSPGVGRCDLRDELQDIWHAAVFDRYGLTEVGPVAAECAAHPGGLHILADEVIAEVVDPRTGELIDDGSPGELVLTTLGRIASPAIRYRTGDLARLVEDFQCPCGRQGPFIEGGVTRLTPAARATSPAMSRITRH